MTRTMIHARLADPPVRAMLRAMSRFGSIFVVLLSIGALACGSSEPASTTPASGPCSEADCGARPPGPRGPCPDGVTIAGPACGRDVSGVCGWTVVECPGAGLPGSAPGDSPEGRACGGMMGLGCQASEYCHYTRDAMCGAADQTGVCQTRPEACAQVVEPVCACDGVTYSNECSANAAGYGVSSDGPCAPPPPG